MKQAVAPITAVALAMIAAACSPPASQSAAPETPITAMPEMPAPPSAMSGPLRGVGTVTAVDAGKVTISHEAIPAINWSAMTMAFTAADPAILSGVKVGDQVAFELKSAAEPMVVVSVTKQ